MPRITGTANSGTEQGKRMTWKSQTQLGLWMHDTEAGPEGVNYDGDHIDMWGWFEEHSYARSAQGADAVVAVAEELGRAGIEEQTEEGFMATVMAEMPTYRGCLSRMARECYEDGARTYLGDLYSNLNDAGVALKA